MPKTAGPLILPSFVAMQASWSFLACTTSLECFFSLIDILGETSTIAAIDAFDEKMESLGYIPLGEYGIKERRFFRKREKSAVNLHIFQEGDSEIERHLHFRNRLRADPEAMKEYVELKRRLVEEDALTSSTAGLFCP